MTDAYPDTAVEAEGGSMRTARAWRIYRPRAASEGPRA